MIEQLKIPIQTNSNKQKLFSLYSEFVRNNSEDQVIKYYTLILETIILTFFEISIIFQSNFTQNKSQFSKIIIQIFHYADLSNMGKQNDNLYLIVKIVILVLLFACIILNLFFYLNYFKSSFFYLAIYYSNRIYKILAIPIFYVLVDSFQKIVFNPLNSLIQILFILYFLNLFVYQKFSFNPVFKNNFFFRIKNQYSTYSFIFWFAKILFIKLYQIDVWLVLLIIALEISKINSLEDYSNPFISIIQRIPAYFSIGASFTVIIMLLWQNQLVNFDIIICSVLFSLLCGIYLKFLKINKQNFLHLKNCKTASQTFLRQFINSWFKKWENLKNQNNIVKSYKIFIKKHDQTCQDPYCFVKTTKLNYFESEDSIHNKYVRQHFQNFSLSLLESKSQNSEESFIFYFIKLYDFKKNIQIKRNNKQLQNLSYSYIQYHIKNLSNIQTINKQFVDSQQNYIQSIRLFYQQIKKIIYKLKIFFTQLKDTQPNLHIIQQSGYQTYLLVQQLKQIFRSIEFNSRIDIKIIQFYLQFMQNVMKDDIQIAETVKRLQKKNRYDFQDNKLQQSTLPTMSVNIKQNGKILMMNCQATKLLKCFRMDVNQKTIQHLLKPEIKLQDLQLTFKRISQKSLYCLIESWSQQLVPIKIRSRIKQNLYSKQYFLQFEPINKINEQIYLILNEKFQMQLYFNRSILFEKSINISINEFYQKYIKIKIQNIKTQSHLEIYNQNLIRVIASVEQTIVFNKFFIKLILKDQTPVEAQQYTYQYQEAKPSNQFNFKIQKIDNKIFYDGNKSKSKEIIIPQKYINTNKTIFETNRINYAKGIKLYRLLNQQIYNIQLEHLNTQVQMYRHQDQCNLYQEHKQIEKNQKIKYIYIFVYFLCFTFLLVLFLYCFVKSTNIKQQTTLFFKKYLQIQYFQILFYRTACVLGDTDFPATVYYNTYNWSQQVISLLNNIKQNQNQMLFDKTQYNITFRNVMYSTYLDQYINIIMSAAYDVAIRQDISKIEQIHYLIGIYLSNYIKYNKVNLLSIMIDKISKSDIQYLILTILAEIISILAFIFIIAFNYFSSQKKKNILFKYRLKTDNQIRQMIQKIQKVQSIIGLYQKSEEIDIYNFLIDKKTYQLRSSPKKISANIFICTNIIKVTFICIATLIGFIIFVYFNFAGQIDLLKEFFITSTSIIESYIGILRITPVTTYGVDFKQIQNIQSGLIYIQQNRYQYPFSQNLSDYINKILFESSCQIILQSIPNFDCDHFGLGYSVQNPFKIGLVYYFNHLHFQLSHNLTNAFPSVGGIAQPFQYLFTNISLQISTEWERNYSKLKLSSQVNLIVEIFLVILLMIIASIFYFGKLKQFEKCENIKNMIKEDENYIIPINKSINKIDA